MPIEVQTSNILEYQFYPTASSMFSFKVRAHNDAHLALTSNARNDEPIFEVLIGGCENSKSVIRRNHQQPNVVEVYTPGILDGGEYRGFWIRWNNNVIAVGREGEAAAFMSCNAHYLFPVNYVGICTGWGVSGTWLLNNEVETLDNLEYQFYPTASSMFTFKVRARNDAHLALTSKATNDEPIFEVFIGGWKNTKSVIRKNNQKPDVVEVSTPGILNGCEYRGFWIRWNNNVIAVGHEGEAAAFMSYNAYKLFPINFVGICTGWGANGSWLLNNESGPGRWVPDAGGKVPPSSIKGGLDGCEQLYIARAHHKGDLIPGKLHPSHGVCYVAYDGGEHAYGQYEVLCGGSGQWIPVKNCNIPPNAFPGGVTALGEKLFIGRASHNGKITLGKVHPSHGCCYIPYSGKEFAYKDFEIYISV